MPKKTKAADMKVVDEKLGKEVHDNVLDGAQIPPELPNMPEGNVPAELRELAEYVIKGQADIEHLKEELKREVDKLTDKMVRANVQVIPVIIDKQWKKRVVIRKSSGVSLKIEDDGMVEETKAKKGKEAAAAVN